ncbi:MAG: transglutaminase family protein [Fimbriimonadaceae bacterium]|nr:transglutaminase family protein [Fimbriimonadaceae bacterium]
MNREALGRRPDPALYWAVLLVATAPLGCGWRQLGGLASAAPAAVLLTVGGLGFARWLSGRPYSRVVLNTGVTLAALASTALLYASDAAGWSQIFSLQWLLSRGIDGQLVVYLVRGIAWIAAFRALTVVSDFDVLLTTGFSLAQFILLSLLEPDRRVVGWLIPYTAGALFILLHYRQRRLVGRADLVVAEPPGEPVLLELRSLGGLGVGVALGALLLSVALSAAGLRGGLVDATRSSLIARAADWFEQVTTQDGRLPRSLDIVGRSAARGEEEVLRWRGGRAPLWRQTVFSVYDGRSWFRRRAPQRLLRRDTAGRYRLTAGPLPAADRQITYEVLLAQPSQVIFSVPCLQAVEVDSQGLYLSQQGVVFNWDTLRPQTGYRLWASEPDDPTWRPTPLRAERRDWYLELPPSLPARVPELARRVAGRGSDQARMNALLNWLGDHKLYTLRPDPVPAEVDAVDYFLFEMPAGWCRHFAAALAVLGRAAGLPTRVVEGYTSGELAADGTTWVVRQKHAHAWAEAWIEGQGWQPFDATDRASEEISALARLYGRIAELWREVPGWVLPALLLLGPALLLLWRLARRPRYRRYGDRRAHRVWERLQRLLARQGPRAGHETELAWARRLVREAGVPAELLLPLVDQITWGRWSGRPWTAPQCATARQALKALAAWRRASRRGR